MKVFRALQASWRRNVPLFREAQTPRPAALAMVFAATYVVLSVIAYAFTTATQGLAVLWLCNGMVAAALLLLPRREAVPVAAIGLITDFVCSVVVGGSEVRTSALIAGLDLAEAVLAANLARRVCGAALDVTRPVRLLRLVGLAIAPATLLAGTTGTLVSMTWQAGDPLTQWITWAGGDFLGMTIALPGALLLARPRQFGPQGERAPRSLWVAVGIWVIAGAVFAQSQAGVLMLLVVMAVILGAFFMRPATVAAAIVGVAITAASQTIAGSGPIWADEPDDLARRILYLQLFLTITAASGYTAVALIADRDRIGASLARTLEVSRDARRRADRAAAAQARFLATVSHEMRTPLNGALGHARALAGRPDLPAAAQSAAGSITTSVNALSVLIEDVLDVSQLGRGELTLSPGPVDVAALVREVADMGRTLIGAKPITISVAAPEPGLGLHRLDGGRVSQVLLHLVANAVKFSDAGDVSITASRSPKDETTDTWRFTVRDHGVGLPPGDIDRMFQPFAQADESSTRRFGGAGLGLAISRALVDLMGGAIGASNPPDGGAVIWFEIPAPQDAPAPAAPRAPGSRPTVLVVDDHQINLEVVKAYLEACDCEIAWCDNGASAVEAVSAKPFDIVFMDVHMPVMDGLDATRAIRALGGAAGATPIVALTAAGTTRDIEACLAAGMDAHLSKPIRGEELLDALLRHGRSPDGETVAA